MTITKGFWRTDIGTKAEVIDVRNGIAIGWVGECPQSWLINGKSNSTTCFNLIEPWIDKPEWDWSTTPPWMNWLAMDDGEFWYMYTNKPTRTGSGFSPAGPDDDIWFIPRQHAPKWSGDSKDSLVGRPGAEVKP